MNRTEERKIQRLELLSQGHKDLVKDSRGYWRPRHSSRVQSSRAASKIGKIKRNVLCRFYGHDRPVVQGKRGQRIKSPICVRCGKEFGKWSR
jgi:hypothetical protein